MKFWRINLISLLIILFAAAIVGQLVRIQVFKHSYYKALAQGQQKLFIPNKGERGEVFFNGGEILATNTRGMYVYIAPLHIEDKEMVAETLSNILNVEKDTIIEKSNNDNLFEEIKMDITEEEERSVIEAKLKGVYVDQAILRTYPQGAMASQIIGFLGGEDIGQYGIEGYYDDILQGKEGFEDNSINLSKESNKGTDLFLAIDYNIQFKAEKLLKKAEEELNTEGGLIIVMEPTTGKILTLANSPNFNPNNYSEIEDFDIFQNKAIQKLFEPGSVFKPITMASALDRDKITPQTTYIDTGKVKIKKYTITNYNGRVFGEQTMTEVLEKSINTGAVFAERQAGHDIFLEYMDKFGFFKPTGIDLQGEEFSENKEFKKGYEINFATASFGQGIEITPIQIVQAFSTIANGGNQVSPYLVEKRVINGKITITKPKVSKTRIISQKTASQLTAMMVSVVESAFTRKARVPGYYVAGKTGTAQVPWSVLGINKRGYSEKTWQSFIGFAPAFNPRFVILVRLDDPATKTAEYSAVPVFQELAKYIIDYLQILPDYDE